MASSEYPDGPRDLTDHAARNRDAWTDYAADYVESGRRAWSGETPPGWGIWQIPETEVRALPDVMGKDTVELGCGTAYWSAWLARTGARPTGVDLTPAQLDTARTCMAEFGPEFPLVEASAEAVPLPDGCADLVLSEYGASIWCDPYLWIPEAARLLRPGGELVFLVNGTILMLCMGELETDPTTPTMLRPYFGMHRVEWPDEPAIEFHLGYGDWIRLLVREGFDVLDMIELRPPADAPPTRYPWMNLEWARQWPCEEIWRARKR